MTSIEAIINRQLLRWELERQRAEDEKDERIEPNPIVTISRQTGSRGSYFGSRLAQKLSYQRLNRNVIEEICKSSGYRHRIIESLDDKYKSNLESLVDSIITGQNVDYSDYHEHLFKVILSMSHLGGVIVMGRGCNFILGCCIGFHIRIVCPYERRIENLINYTKLTKDEATEQVDKFDIDRKTYIKKIFNKEINDPQHYDIILNSGLMDVEEMVDIAVVALNAKMNKLKYFDHDCN